jgi:putative phosphoesterase
MRLALLSDIHGNLMALEAVLADLQARPVDRLICLGDVVSQGPQPRQTLRRLRALNVPCVMGNHDAELVAAQMPAIDEPWIAAQIAWCRSLLEPEDLAYLRTFQPRLGLELAGGQTLLACHGSPRDNTEFIWSSIANADLEALLAGYDESVIAFGHTHEPVIRQLHGRLVVNPGSVGYPIRRPWLLDRPIHLLPHAEYAILSAEPGCLSVEFRRLPLDQEALFAAARASDIPGLDLYLSFWD